MHHGLRLLAGLVSLLAGLALLAFGDRAAAWAANLDVAGVMLCLAAGLLLAPLLNAYLRSRRGLRGEDFAVRPRRSPRWPDDQDPAP